MPGHLFVIRSDLMQLACDAWALPCDAGLYVSEAFAEGELSPLAGRVRDGRIGIDAPSEWSDNGVRVLPLPAQGDDPRVWLINTGGVSTTTHQWYLEAVDQFIRATSRLAPARNRPRPLVALPFVGSGLGGHTLAKGGLLEALLSHLRDRAADADVDIALVLRSGRAFAAAQALRRADSDRFWPEFSDDVRQVGDELARDARDGRMVLFVGAGVSAGAGLPTWKGLLDALAQEAGFTATDDVDTRLSDLDRARLIERRLATKGIDLRDAIRREMAPAVRFSLGHALLAGLPSNEAVTTNYDQLYEAAVRAAGRPIAVLPYEAVRPGAGWLLKMHGSIDHPRDLVLTREDYIRYADRRGALAGIVQALLITRRMLFVGFSLSDDNFHRIADDVRRAVRGTASGSSEPFGTSLLLGQDQPALTELWRGDLCCVGIGDPDEDIPHRARDLEIFLDHVLAGATTGAEHLLDPAFDVVLTDPERALADALRQFADSTPSEARRAPQWPMVARLLDDLGSALRESEPK